MRRYLIAFGKAFKLISIIMAFAFVIVTPYILIMMYIPPSLLGVAALVLWTMVVFSLLMVHTFLEN